MRTKTSTIVRKYELKDEIGWLRCRVLAFLDSAYYDDVYTSKESYESNSIELVAERKGQIIGLLDIECESRPGSVCSKTMDSSEQHLAGMIWHLAVHPDFRREGIATSLLEESIVEAKRRGLSRFEAWTRDDKWVEEWYHSKDFKWIQSYYHVFISSNEMSSGEVAIGIDRLKPVSVFAHYTGNNSAITQRFKRVHKCSRYDLIW